MPPKKESRSITSSANQGHAMLRFKGEDAEAVMAKALEGGSDAEKEGN